MAGFANARALADAQDAGRYLYASFRKVPSISPGAGAWFDLSMSPGNPSPNYYIGEQNVFTPMSQSGNGGIRHGVNVSPNAKFLRKLMAMTSLSTAVPLPMKLCDYLGFYGFIDESVTDEQFMDNTLSPTRSVIGAQLMPVIVAAQIGGATFTVSYTNQDGVAGRVTGSVLMSTVGTNGRILHSFQNGAQYPDNGAFLPLQAGDSSVQSVQSVTVAAPGDVGLFALVLVKPIAAICLNAVDAPTEIDYLTDMATLPKIEDDAYLNFICLPNGALVSAPITGIIETTWG